jgi:polyisoprenoid-binding protein YceI
MRLAHSFVALSALSLILASAGHAAAQAKTFKVDDSGGSQIQFVSDAPLERTTGVTSKASGEITVDPASPASAKADIKIDMTSFKTGIDLRDEHFRSENWLDAKKYPHAEFVITKVSGLDKLEPNKSAEVTISGKFSLHGVTKELTTKAKVRWISGSEEAAKNKVPGDALRIQATFVVKLEDHKVSIPSIVALKVSPNITVNIDLRALAK